MRKFARLGLTLTVLAAVAGASPAQADGEGFLGGLVGGVVGGILGSQMNKDRERERERPTASQPPRTQKPVVIERVIVKRPAIDPVTRAENRDIQAALNYVGCDAGRPDGVFGPRTKLAIRCLQSKINAHPTGSLTSQQRVALLKLYRVAKQRVNPPSAGRPQQTPVEPAPIATGPDTLIAALKRMDAPADPAQVAPISAPTQPPAPAPVHAADTRPSAVYQAGVRQPPQTNYAAPAPAPIQLAAAPPPHATTAAAAQAPAAEAAPASPTFKLPSLGQITGEPATTPASLCQALSANLVAGGAAPKAGDPAFAKEQFCVVRQALIAGAEGALTRFGVTVETARPQCQGFLGAIREPAQTAGKVSPQETLAAAAAILGVSAAGQAEMASSAVLCAGLAYLDDDAVAAQGAALLGLAAGHGGLGELVAWHLAFGLGRDANPTGARDWLTYVVRRLDDDAKPAADLPGSDRARILEAALKSLPGGAVGFTLPALALLKSPAEQAQEFFAMRGFQYRKTAGAMSDALNGSLAELLDQCRDGLGAAPTGDGRDVLLGRLCLAVGAAAADRQTMEASDRLLAGMGDAEAARALTLYSAWTRP